MMLGELSHYDACLAPLEDTGKGGQKGSRLCMVVHSKKVLAKLIEESWSQSHHQRKCSSLRNGLALASRLH